MTVIDLAEWTSPHPSGGHLLPSPIRGERLEAPCTEAGGSQAELAERIEPDARLADLDRLTDEERATTTNVIDALVTKVRLRLITGGAG